MKNVVKTACILFLVAILGTPALAWPWVDDVPAYNPGPGDWQGVYRDYNRVLGRPYGVSTYQPDNTHAVTLGDGGSITLHFDDPIYDDPRNPMGLDFIIFGNAFWVGDNPAVRWQKPGFVEVSQDDSHWYLILPNILPADLKGAPQPDQDTGQSSTILRGYANVTPTLALPDGVQPEEFYTVPDRPSYAGDPASLLIDSDSGGGDAMDIAWAVKETSPGVPALDPGGHTIPANLPWISYVRVTDAVMDDYYLAPSLGIDTVVSAAAAVLPEAQSVGAATREPDGRIVQIASAVLVQTGSSGGAYVQAPDRSAGTYVTGLPQMTPGTLLRIIGRLHHDPDGDRVEALVYDVLGQQAVPAPISVDVRTLASGSGISPLGMVVRTWGRVSYGGPPSQFWLTGPDGSQALVYTEWPRPAEGSLVMVTAPSRRAQSGPALYPAASDDIQTLAAPQD